MTLQHMNCTKTMPVECVLPCASSNRVVDRFGILEDACEDSDGTVSFWLLLRKLLNRNITTWLDLLDLLETVSFTLRGSSSVAGDYGSLRLAVENETSFFTNIWPSILRFAVALPESFTTGRIQKLVPYQTLNLSQQQCASLVAHQFLCSFESPRSDFYDFSVWYDSNQRHPAAVSAYLKSLFAYFYLRGNQNSDGLRAQAVEFCLWTTDFDMQLDRVTNPSTHCLKDLQLSKITTKILNSHSTECHKIDHSGKAGAVVVSANKDIGFGQSATQEELHMGAAPEACVAVLFTPQLKDDQALSINSAQPIVQFHGQRRNISWIVHDPPVGGGRLLFMDALEIDLADDILPKPEQTHDALLPDLLASNIKRELTKSYAAFTSWPQTADSTVFTGQWGCGAFNGEPTVKLLLLWTAASLAGRRLQVLFDEAEREYARSFEKLIERVSSQSVSDIMSLLLSVPKTTQRLGVMQWLDESLNI
ncbi:poly(ADP-ribose) glycohydrolase [Cordyceps javanica]|nr:poly(ADP-ribose) glycohydrolase [Cordyceps javanica]